VRSRTIGYLRDVRRLTVALSRARLGLYILGRHQVFGACLELKPAFDILGQRPHKLILTTGEMFPTTRRLDQSIEGTAMEGVEHLGQYVYEMTQAKIKALGGDASIMDEIPTDQAFNDDDEDEDILPAKGEEQSSVQDELA
jgi:intron-binding protein aquarius